MTDRETIFLSREEAVEAICLDFRRYDPQMVLLCQIIGLVLRDRVAVKREGEKNGLWVSVPGRRNMRWMEGPELVEYLCREIKETDLDPQLLASICARVFHSRAWEDRDPQTGRKGVQIETGMEAFSCRQCGQCCMSLDYHNELTSKDVARWEKLGRTDILKWVRVVEGEGGTTEYRIWTIPGTTRLAEVCPFLKEIPSQNRWGCLIHDVKPDICREYPLSRKHAMMTGCVAFAGSMGWG